MPPQVGPDDPELLDAGLPVETPGVFTTRRGGTSRPPWDGLDLALHVGDDPERVTANRALLARALGGPELVHAEQVHGAGVAVLRSGAGPAAGDRALPAVDALVTDRPGTALVVLAADCLPVLLADPVAGVVAAAHAGRGGLVAGVLPAAVEAMVGLGADARAVRAVLGPAVCGRCYELPEDLADAVERAVPGSRTRTSAGTAGVDLADGAEGQLRRLGVVDVRRVGGCTVEQPDRFYSYRRDGVTGRHAGVVRRAAAR